MAARKSAAKKSAAKKSAAKRSSPRKSASRKSAPRKSAPRKSSPRKSASRKSGSRAKKATKKRSAAKKRTPAKRRPAAKKAAKRSAGRTTSKKSTRKTASKASSRKKKRSSPFDRKFLDAQKKLLLSERDTYLRQATSLKAEADSLVADVEPGDVQFDEESGEGDTLAVERERDLALSAQAKDAVEEIDHALAKLDDGTYGICEVSGEPIPKERLKAIPWARERVEYKVGGLSRR